MELFNLDNYKNYLIDFLRYERDNNNESKNNRKKYLESHYSDEFLQKIIDDTLKFILVISENNLNNENGYVDIDLTKDANYIFLNLTGGWFSDVLYSIEIDGNEKIISRRLLKKFLGNKFKIDEDSKVEETLDDSDDLVIYNEYYYPFIRIIGDFKLLKEKYDELRKTKEQELLLVLKRNIGVCNKFK